jgi:hypothetical protein
MAKTYATLDEFNVALQATLNGLTAEIGAVLPKLSKDLAGSIKVRVQSTGVDGDGKAFSTPYSRSHTYKKKKYGQGSYGQQTSFKNFTYQGTMWNNFDFRTVSVAQDMVKSTIGFAGSNVYKSNEELVGIHSDNESQKYSIAQPNKTEEEELVNAIGNAIGQYIERTLG